MTYLRIACLAIVIVGIGLIVSAAPALAQEAGVAGLWQLEVTTDQGITHPTVSFEQNGGTLTGDYSSEALGERRIRGTVDGETVMWSFSANLQGQDIPVQYRGSLAGDGTISGTVDIAGGMMTGSFTAYRPDA
jgi:hypothetical protein